MTSLLNKNVIVTGGGRGIGKATCQLLSQEGANVVITCRTEEEGLAVEKELSDNGGSALYICLLYTSPSPRDS